MDRSKSKYAILLLLVVGLFACNHAEAEVSASQCAVACKPGSSTPRCMKLKKSDGHGEAFGRVYAKMIADEKTLEAGWLMSNFGVTSDPCNRADSIRTGIVWENIGSTCRISSSVSIFNNKQLILSIDVPRRVAYERTISGSTLQLKPASPMAVVTFADSDLNKDWGGGILAVNATPNLVQFQLPKGCIQIPTK